VGIKLFGVDIGKIVSDAMPVGSMPVATLRKASDGAVDPANLTASPAVTYTDYTTRGIVASFAVNETMAVGLATGVQVARGDKKVLLLGEPLYSAGDVKPTVDDLVVIGGETLIIVGVIGRDPASATWKLQCRGP
jgi:hypothetical protein